MTHTAATIRARTLAVLAAGALVLAGCGDVRRSLGLEKTVPDEFTVVRKAPLTLPPDFGLRPPRPGAPRPAAVDPTQQAQAALGGQTQAIAGAEATTPGELAFLREAGANRVNADIREILLTETTQLAEKDKSLVDRLIFWQRAEDESVIDATAESRRLRETALATDATTSNQETPTIRRRKRSLLRGLF